MSTDLTELGLDAKTEDFADNGGAGEADAPADGLSQRPGRARRAWSPEAGAELAALLRLLVWRAWLVSGRDDDAIAAVRRNESALRDVFGRLGWVLVVERDLVRLRKSPPSRPQAWAAQGPNSLTCCWFFLLVAAAESMPPKVPLAQLVTAARAAAAEATVPATGKIDERRAIVAALRLLDERGVVEEIDGDIDGYLNDDNAPVLLLVHHTRLVHVIANAGASDPAAAPNTWLGEVTRETDVARRMRRRLIDDAVVHVADLDDDERDWLRRRLRGDDGGPLADAFGLAIERRAEGAAFIVPDDRFRHDRELGPLPFPNTGGTVPHAALLLCDHAASDAAANPADSQDAGRPGSGWLPLSYETVVDHLRTLGATVGSGRGGWRAELVENPAMLAGQVRALLTARDLLRVDPPSASGSSGDVWWFSPATTRWPAPPAAPAAPKTVPPAPSTAEPDMFSRFNTTDRPTALHPKSKETSGEA